MKVDRDGDLEALQEVGQEEDRALQDADGEEFLARVGGVDLLREDVEARRDRLFGNQDVVDHGVIIIHETWTSVRRTARIRSDLAGVRRACRRSSRRSGSFHQFLQGVHRTSLRGPRGRPSPFAPLYEQIKRIKETKGVEPDADDAGRDGAARRPARRPARDALRGRPPDLAQHVLRQFFERVKAGDEELLLSLLKFYFYANSSRPTTSTRSTSS